MLGIALQLATPAHAEATLPCQHKTIVFVCLHGSVKSQMAAAHFNQIARERGLPYTAISRGVEVDASIPTRIRDGLSLDGLAPLDDVPQALTANEAAGAVKVIAFDAVPDDKRGVAEVNYWSDVPPATRDYAAARDVDRAPHRRSRAGAGGAGSSAGNIAGRGHRHRRAKRPASPCGSTHDVSSDFKVQDGLIFNAVHDGDQVEITVENIEGAKTIVGLKKL